VDKGAIISKELAADIDSKYSNASISYISGAGHGIQRERYAETLAAIQTFFKQH
jgi:pimeloyl-ACP methyl ester carboxylesterase